MCFCSRRKAKRSAAHRQLAKLIDLSRHEGYVWVICGASGSGKSAFLQTLEYKFKDTVKTFVIVPRTRTSHS